MPKQYQTIYNKKSRRVLCNLKAFYRLKLPLHELNRMTLNRYKILFAEIGMESFISYPRGEYIRNKGRLL